MSGFHHSFRNLATKLGVSLLAFVMFLLIPRWIGPEWFGLYSYLVAFTGLIIPLTSLGIGSGIIYYLSKGEYALASVFHFVLRAGLALAAINVILLLLLYRTGAMEHIDPGIQGWHWTALLVTVFFQALSFMMGRALYGQAEYRALNRLDLLTSISNPAFMLIMVWIMDVKTADFIYYALALFSVWTAALHWVFIRRYWVARDTLGHSGFLKRSFVYGLKAWAGDLALRANLRLDQLLLATAVSNAALGVYGVAVRLVELIWMIPDAAGPVLFNAVAGLHDNASRLSLVARTHRILVWLCTAALFFWLGICIWIIIPWALGEAYSHAWIPLLILTPGTLFLISSKILTKLFSAGGSVHWTSQITIFGSGISILLYFMLIPSWGIQGAAMASSLGYAALAVAGWYILISEYRIRLSEFFMLKKTDLDWLMQKARLLFFADHEKAQP